MKIELVAINAKYIHSNLAVYNLKAYAKKVLSQQSVEQDVEILEYTINQRMDEILADLFLHKPDVVCFSCYLWNISYVKQILVELKKVLPNVRIWLGGPEVSYDATQVLEEFGQVEGIMRGEGEETFAELLNVFYTGEKNYEDIHGITYRLWKTDEESDQIVENPDRAVMDLSEVPFVYEDLDAFANKILYYESSRGCPFSCSYCLSSIDKCLRFRDLNLVFQELQSFLDAKVPQVKFIDRTFNCNHAHAQAIWKYLLEHDQGVTNFHFEVAADLLNEEEIELISKMRPGLIQLEIGIQSTNPRTIEEIHRVMDFEKVSTCVKRVQATGNVHQHLDLIAGLPYEGLERFRESFRQVYALKPEQLQLGFLKVLKGSRMHDGIAEYGLCYQEQAPYEVLSTKWLSYEEVLHLKGVEEMVELYYNSGQFVCTLQQMEKRISDSFALYEGIAAYYKKKGLSSMSHSRIARYEILYAYLQENDAVNEEVYRQCLTMDLYLRENLKQRPAFLGEAALTKEEEAQFYDAEVGRWKYLQGYESYEKRQIRKMTHLEKVGEKFYLFDYRQRNPLTNQARVVCVEIGEES